MSEPIHTPIDTPPRNVESIGLSLSGGGYRAMLFHAGAVLRLVELGVHRRLSVVTSVSGGALFAAVLAKAWTRFANENDAVTRVQQYRTHVLNVVYDIASRGIDAAAVISSLNPWDSPSQYVERRHLAYLSLTDSNGSRPVQLRDLPAYPCFLFNAVSLNTGRSVVFSRRGVFEDSGRPIDLLAVDGVGRGGLPVASHRPMANVGDAGPDYCDSTEAPYASAGIPLARAVAASGAFPPILSPVRIPQSNGEWLSLVDGGVNDNLGLNAAFMKTDAYLVSDGGGRLSKNDSPGIPLLGLPGAGMTVWLSSQTARVVGVLSGQPQNLFRQQVFSKLNKAWGYWDLNGVVIDPVKCKTPCPALSVNSNGDTAAALARTATRLAPMSTELREQLVNAGYAHCDRIVQCYVPELTTGQSIPASWPFEQHRLDRKIRASVSKFDLVRKWGVFQCVLTLLVYGALDLFWPLAYAPTLQFACSDFLPRVAQAFAAGLLVSLVLSALGLVFEKTRHKPFVIPLGVPIASLLFVVAMYPMLVIVLALLVATVVIVKALTPVPGLALDDMQYATGPVTVSKGVAP